MTGSIRCGCAFGLSVLLLGGMLSPNSAVADTSDPPTPSTAPASPRPSQSTSYRLEQSQFALTVSPSRLIVKHGDIGTTQKISVVNRGQAPLAVTIQKRDFSANRDGSLRYSNDAPYAASNWVTLSRTQLNIKPGGTEIVEAQVKAPPKFEPGDHQVAIVFMVPAGKTEANIRINRGVASPLYVTAPGPVVDAVALSDLRAPTFVSLGSAQITATVTNTGTVHHDFRAPSPLTVQGAGKAQPFSDFTVPRDSIRDIATTWNPPFMCICRPTVSLTSPDGGIVTQTVRVIVFPWQWFGAGLGVVLLTLLLVKLARRHFQAQVLKAAALHQRVGSEDV